MQADVACSEPHKVCSLALSRGFWKWEEEGKKALNDDNDDDDDDDDDDRKEVLHHLKVERVLHHLKVERCCTVAASRLHLLAMPYAHLFIQHGWLDLHEG